MSKKIRLLACFVLACFVVLWLQLSNIPGDVVKDDRHDQTHTGLKPDKKPEPQTEPQPARQPAPQPAPQPERQPELEPRAVAVQATTRKPAPLLIHVCYTPEDTDEQLTRMIRSMRSILVSAKPATRKRLVFHILGKKLKRLNSHLSHLQRKGEIPRDIKVYRGVTDLVPKERKVHGGGNLKKLEKDEVYVRFFLPSILDKSVDKYLYLDTDTAVFSDLAAVYDQVLQGKYTLAAGVQNSSKCTMQKMVDLNDKRLKHLGIKPDDPCLSGGAFFVDRWRWVKENRTQRWEHWIAENYKKKLYYLGCMPPQMIDFHNQWEELSDTLLRDFKGHQCCPPKYSGSLLLNGQSSIVHPLKDIEDFGVFRRHLEVLDDSQGHDA